MKRRGFGLIQALMVIVLISGLMTIAMKYATISAKQTADSYIRESAELFMNSAVELSLLAIGGHDRSKGCLKEVNITSSDLRFNAEVNITKYFVYDGKDNNGSNFNCDSDRIQPIQTKESHGMVLLEIKVDTNLSNPKNRGKKITIYRRTLQRP